MIKTTVSKSLKNADINVKALYIIVHSFLFLCIVIPQLVAVVVMLSQIQKPRPRRVHISAGDGGG